MPIRGEFWMLIDTPENLAIPELEFISESVIRIG